jgi:hypothetical protein
MGLLNSSPFIFDIDFRYIPSDSDQPLNMAADINYIYISLIIKLCLYTITFYSYKSSKMPLFT